MRSEITAALKSFGGRLARRLRQDIGASLGFALFGSFNSVVLARLPELIEYAAKHGLPDFCRHLLYQTVASMLAAIVIIVSVRLWTDTGSNMVRRPLRFIVVMLVITHLANLVGFGVTYIFAPTRPHWWPIPLEDYFKPWLELMLWGSILAWLYFLFLQRQEDRMRFSALLAKRALLAHQISHSELLTARAQIDPALLISVLRTVHKHYPCAPQEANDLLDQLIAYLRMAMNRKRQSDASRSLQIVMEQSLQTILLSVATLENQYE